MGWLCPCILPLPLIAYTVVEGALMQLYSYKESYFSIMIKGVVTISLCCFKTLKLKHIAIKEKPEMVVDFVSFDNIAFPLQAY